MRSTAGTGLDPFLAPPWEGGERTSPWAAMLVAVVVLALLTTVLRFSLNVDQSRLIWDEIYMAPVVETIVTDGWQTQNTIDYADTKGPVFFWGFAALGELFGHKIQHLRFANRLLFVLTGIPLGLLASYYRLSWRRTVAAALLFALLPYNAVLAQIFMSETSFLLGSACLMVAFLWGLQRGDGRSKRLLGPLVFGLLTAVLLHHRPHVAATAAAAVLVATWRDGLRSWPWWVAGGSAALLRVPLYLRWGGMVSPEWQSLAGLGMRLDSLTYLSIAMLPCTGVFLLAALLRKSQRALWWVAAGAVVGLALSTAARPDLSATADGQRRLFQGMAATGLRLLEPGLLQSAAITGLSILGAASLAAIGALVVRGRIVQASQCIEYVVVINVVLGWLMYGLTRGVVYDRYILPFVALLPLLWVKILPSWMLLLLGAALAAMTVGLARSHWLL